MGLKLNFFFLKLILLEKEREREGCLPSVGSLSKLQHTRLSQAEAEVQGSTQVPWE